MRALMLNYECIIVCMTLYHDYYDDKINLSDITRISAFLGIKMPYYMDEACTGTSKSLYCIYQILRTNSNKVFNLM